MSFLKANWLNFAAAAIAGIVMSWVYGGLLVLFVDPRAVLAGYGAAAESKIGLGTFLAIAMFVIWKWHHRSA
jgi:hypothetical protein